jgi:transposase-like protein
MSFQRKYDDAFKQKAVAMVMQKGQKVKAVAQALGISRFLIYEWKRQFHPSLTQHRARNFYGKIHPG